MFLFFNIYFNNYSYSQLIKQLINCYYILLLHQFLYTEFLRKRFKVHSRWHTPHKNSNHLTMLKHITMLELLQLLLWRCFMLFLSSSFIELYCSCNRECVSVVCITLFNWTEKHFARAFFAVNFQAFRLCSFFWGHLFVETSFVRSTGPKKEHHLRDSQIHLKRQQRSMFFSYVISTQKPCSNLHRYDRIGKWVASHNLRKRIVVFYAILSKFKRKFHCSFLGFASTKVSFTKTQKKNIGR